MNELLETRTESNSAEACDFERPAFGIDALVGEGLVGGSQGVAADLVARARAALEPRVAVAAVLDQDDRPPARAEEAR